jgi:hypothetical protein
MASGGSIAVWGAHFGMSGVGALTPLVITDMFGLKQFGSIMGLTRTALIIPVFVGPIMARLIFDATDSYNLMFGITIGLLVVSIAIFMMIRSPFSPKIND